MFRQIWFHFMIHRSLFSGVTNKKIQKIFLQKWSGTRIGQKMSEKAATLNDLQPEELFFCAVV